MLSVVNIQLLLDFVHCLFKLYSMLYILQLLIFSTSLYLTAYILIVALNIFLKKTIDLINAAVVTCLIVGGSLITIALDVVKKGASVSVFEADDSLRYYGFFLLLINHSGEGFLMGLVFWVVSLFSFLTSDSLLSKSCNVDSDVLFKTNVYTVLFSLPFVAALFLLLVVMRTDLI